MRPLFLFYEPNHRDASQVKFEQNWLHVRDLFCYLLKVDKTAMVVPVALNIHLWEILKIHTDIQHQYTKHCYDWLVNSTIYCQTQFFVGKQLVTLTLATVSTKLSSS